MSSDPYAPLFALGKIQTLKNLGLKRYIKLLGTSDGYKNVFYCQLKFIISSTIKKDKSIHAYFVSRLTEIKI